MREILCVSSYFGVLISLIGYGLGVVLKRKFKIALFNPLLVSIIFVIAALGLLGVDYESYNNGAKYLSYLLTPATVCLAIPLYPQLELLKGNYKAILGGIVSGALASFVSVFALSKLLI